MFFNTESEVGKLGRKTNASGSLLAAASKSSFCSFKTLSGNALLPCIDNMYAPPA